jgi:hypothetical protein
MLKGKKTEAFMKNGTFVRTSMVRRKKKTYTTWQKVVRAVPRVLIFLFLSFFLMVIVLLGTEDYFLDLPENERLAMLSALAGVAFYMSFKTIDDPNWSVREQFVTSVRYIFYFIIFFIGLNLILLALRVLRDGL